MIKMFDPYEALSVGREASPEDIRSAYRTAARRLHPDRNPDSDTTAQMQEINLAWEILGDEEKKRAFDSGTFEVQTSQRNSGVGLQARFRFTGLMRADEWVLYRKIENIWEKGEKIENVGSGLQWRVKFKPGDETNPAPIRMYEVDWGEGFIDLHGKDTLDLRADGRWMVRVLRQLVQTFESLSYHLRQLEGEREMIDLGRVIFLHRKINDLLLSGSYFDLRNYLTRKFGVRDSGYVGGEFGYFFFDPDTEGDLGRAERDFARAAEGNIMVHAPMAQNHYDAPFLGDELGPPDEVRDFLGRERVQEGETRIRFGDVEAGS